MRAASRIWHRTEAGERALKRRTPRLAAEERALLASIEGATHFEAIGARTRRALGRLESEGLVESVAVEWLRELWRLGDYQPEPISLRRRNASPSSS